MSNMSLKQNNRHSNMSLKQRINRNEICPLQQAIIDNMSEQQKRFCRISEPTPPKQPKTKKTPPKQPKTKTTPTKQPKTKTTPTKQPKTKTTPTKQPKTKTTPPKQPKTKKTLMSSVKLQQKSAGYLLAAANAAKRGL
jgi:outer membrane biosynthesis protein TonB